MTATCIHDHLTDNLVDHLYIIAEHLKKAAQSRENTEGDVTEKNGRISSAVSSLSLLSLPKIGMHVERAGSGDTNGITPYHRREVFQETNLQHVTKELPKMGIHMATAAEDDGSNGVISYQRQRMEPLPLLEETTKGALNCLDTLRARLHSQESHITILKQKLAELEKQVQATSSQSEDRDFRLSLIENINYDGTMIWKIPQFSQRMEDAHSGKYTSIFSLPFYSGRYGYKMCRLYILSDSIGNDTHMSLFFAVTKGEFSHKVSLQSTITSTEKVHVMQ